LHRPLAGRIRKRSGPKVIVYHSGTGHTAKLAAAIAKGAGNVVGVKVQTRAEIYVMNVLLAAEFLGVGYLITTKKILMAYCSPHW